MPEKSGDRNKEYVEQLTAWKNELRNLEGCVAAYMCEAVETGSAVYSIKVAQKLANPVHNFASTCTVTSMSSTVTAVMEAKLAKVKL